MLFSGPKLPRNTVSVNLTQPFVETFQRKKGCALFPLPTCDVTLLISPTRKSLFSHAHIISLCFSCLQELGSGQSASHGKKVEFNEIVNA